MFIVIEIVLWRFETLNNTKPHRKSVKQKFIQHKNIVVIVFSISFFYYHHFSLILSRSEVSSIASLDENICDG